MSGIAVDLWSYYYVNNDGSPFVFRAYTDSNGDYLVINWPAGDDVAVVTYIPTNRTLTTYISGYRTDLQVIPVTANMLQPTWPVGLDPVAGTLKGHVFIDSNGNGAQAGGETGKSGLAVYVYSYEDDHFQVVQTNSNGDFTATVPYGRGGLASTAFGITIPALNTVTTHNDAQLVVVPRGGTGNATAIGLDPTGGTVAGRVFNDANGNGVQDNGEAGKANVDVYMLSTDYYLRYTTTNANGDYSVQVPYGNPSTALVIQVPGGNFVTSINNGQLLNVPRAGTGQALAIGLRGYAGYGANGVNGVNNSKTTTGINNSGVVIGSGQSTGHAFVSFPVGHVKSTQTMGVVVAGCAGAMDGDSLPPQELDALSGQPADASDAVAVNDHDAVAGSSEDASGNEQASVWTPDATAPQTPVEPVNPVASQQYNTSEADDINNNGRVVGEGTNGVEQAFAVNQDGGKFVSLHLTLNNDVGGGIQQSFAHAINDQDVAVGAFKKDGKTQAFAIETSQSNTAVKPLNLQNSDLKDYPSTEGVLVNNQNQMVIKATKDGRNEIWLYNIPGLGPNGAPVKVGEGTAISMNHAGQFVWEDTGHVRHIYDIKSGINLTPLMPSGAKLWGVNANGQGAGDTASGPARLAPVTETHTLSVGAGQGGTVHADPAGPSLLAGTVVTISANADGGNILAGWTINGQQQGWVNPLHLTMTQDFTVQATFAPLYRFNDVPADDPPTTRSASWRRAASSRATATAPTARTTSPCARRWPR